MGDLHEAKDDALNQHGLCTSVKVQTPFIAAEDSNARRLRHSRTFGRRHTVSSGEYKSRLLFLGSPQVSQIFRFGSLRFAWLSRVKNTSDVCELFELEKRPCVS